MAANGIELVWPGKYEPDGTRSRLPREARPPRPLDRLPAGSPIATEFAATTQSARDSRESSDRIVVGDNLALLTHLAAVEPETIDLVYIDPPFNTGSRFEAVRRVGTQDESGKPRELSLPGYSDRWGDKTAGFLRMLDPRLRLLHRVLAPTGSLYVHVDPTVGHAVKLLLDEIFGEGCFQREIVWRIGWLSGFKTMAKNWIRNHDLIFYYTKDPRRFTFNKRYIPHAPGYVRRDGKPPKGKGVPLEDVWNANEAELGFEGRASLDSIQIKSFSREKTGWATQKNESILERILDASSSPGDLVADFFAGSGTTAAVAARMGRRFLIADASPLAGEISLIRVAGIERTRDVVFCAQPPLDETQGMSSSDAVGSDARPHDEGSRAAPLLEVDLEHRGQAVVVKLIDYRYPEAASLPEALRPANDARGVELLEGWWIDDGPVAGQPCTLSWGSVRTHHHRQLAVVSSPVEVASLPSTLVIRTSDVLGRRMTYSVVVMSKRRGKAGKQTGERKAAAPPRRAKHTS